MQCLSREAGGKGSRRFRQAVGLCAERRAIFRIADHRMAYIGHPVIGDPEYGAAFRTKANRLPEPARSLAAGFPRQALHAAVLGFIHPVSGEPMRFETRPPDDMARLAEALVAA